MMQPRDLFKITPITDEQEVELRNETHHVQIIEKWQAEDEGTAVVKHPDHQVWITITASRPELLNH